MASSSTGMYIKHNVVSQYETGKRTRILRIFSSISVHTRLPPGVQQAGRPTSQAK